MANDLLQNLPALKPGWSWVKLGDVAKLIRGVSYSKDQASKSPRENYIPIIRATNINSILNFKDLIYVPKDLIKKEQIIRDGDILIAMSSGSKDLVGKAAQSYFDTNVSFGTFCGLIRFSSNVNKRFFGYFFQSREYRNHISNISMGVNINNLRREHIEELAIPLPPLSEQKKIVEKIEELFNSLDSGVASLKKAKEQIRLYRQSVLAAAFSGRLTRKDDISSRDVIFSSKAAEPKPEYSNQLPDGWKWVRLGEVVKIVSGNTPKGLVSISNKGSFPFYKVSDMNSAGNEKLMYKSNLYLTSEELKKLKIKIYPKHTTIFPKRGGAILTNKKRLLAQDSSFDLNLMGLIPSEKVNYQYLHYWVIMLDLTTIYDGSNVPQINNKNVEPLDFPLPPLDQQTQIVEEIEKRFSEADNLGKAIDDSLAKAETLRQSILKQAFEGRLV